MYLKDLVNTEQELALYLVSEGIKPAAFATISSNNRTLSDNALHKSSRFLHITVNETRFKEEFLEETANFLNNLYPYLKSSIKFDVIPYMRSIEFGFGNRKKTIYVHTQKDRIQKEYIYVGKDETCLEKLLSAKTMTEKGLAFGYPIDAVDAFNRIIAGERRDGTYMQVSMAKAKQARIEIPDWIAYLGHVPKHFDIVGENISESSEIQGKTYRDFVRKNNPELAIRIEKHFSERNLPDSWEKAKGGGYCLNYALRPDRKFN